MEQMTELATAMTLKNKLTQLCIPRAHSLTTTDIRHDGLEVLLMIAATDHPLMRAD